MIHLIITGPHGRMGRAILNLAEADNQYRVVGTIAGRNTTPILWGGSSQTPVTSLSALELPPPPARPVIIDFSTPEATLTLAAEATSLGLPLVIGTTGFSDEQKQQIRAHSSRIPLLLSYNMSLGITLLAQAVEHLAARLTNYDIEITETHHRLKKDAPSGTALLLADAAAAGRRVQLSETAIHGRHGFTGERPTGQIGIHAIRGGDVVGDHTVLFAGIGERIELTHKASSRDTFATGALHAARYLSTQPPGYYTMRDVLA